MNMDINDCYIGMMDEEGGVQTSAPIRAFHIETRGIVRLNEYLQELQDTYPGGYVFIKEF